MKYLVAFVSLVLLGCAAIWAQNAGRKAGNKVGKEEQSAPTQQPTGAAKTAAKTSAAPDPTITVAVQKGAKWLA